MWHHINVIMLILSVPCKPCCRSKHLASQTTMKAAPIRTAAWSTSTAVCSCLRIYSVSCCHQSHDRQHHCPSSTNSLSRSVKTPNTTYRAHTLPLKNTSYSLSDVVFRLWVCRIASRRASITSGCWALSWKCIARIRTKTNSSFSTSSSVFARPLPSPESCVQRSIYPNYFSWRHHFYYCFSYRKQITVRS